MWCGNRCLAGDLKETYTTISIGLEWRIPQGKQGMLVQHLDCAYSIDIFRREHLYPEKAKSGIFVGALMRWDIYLMYEPCVRACFFSFQHSHRFENRSGRLLSSVSRSAGLILSFARNSTLVLGNCRCMFSSSFLLYIHYITLS